MEVEMRPTGEQLKVSSKTWKYDPPQALLICIFAVLDISFVIHWGNLETQRGSSRLLKERKVSRNRKYVCLFLPPSCTVLNGPAEVEENKTRDEVARWKPPVSTEVEMRPTREQLKVSSKTWKYDPPQALLICIFAVLDISFVIHWGNLETQRGSSRLLRKKSL